ncbi:MAG: hypothetical protein SOT28_03830 [Fusicatenibacter sp.]|nr:hypothetical protein [Lachnospiraceae bacterium]MDY2937432.1 hypothetical protein [Fusicatenibacter sp.]
MCRILGFLLFWTGFGLLIGLMIRSSLLTIIAAGVLLLVGYQLFLSGGK